MKTLTQRIGGYVADLAYPDIPAEVCDYAKRILLDGIACAYGGLDSEAAAMVRNTAAQLGDTSQATLIGKAVKVSAPLAALANGFAIHYQDFNDVYIGTGWTGHPSDNIATLLAVAEWQKRSGCEFLRAMVAAYEVDMRFQDLPSPKIIWHRGWHHSVICAYAGAAGVGSLLGLDSERIAHALALSGARSNMLAEIRRGDISMDKALSAPIIASQSILYTLLAQQGFTGCSTLLEGPFGFGHAVTGDLDLEPLVPQAGDYRLLKVSLKPYPIGGMIPAMVQAAIEIRGEFNVRPDEIESIRLLTFEEAVKKPSWDPHKLVPTNKETADHSFHYCVAVALMAGEVTSRQFTDDWIKNPAVAALIAKTRLEIKPELTKVFLQGARPGAVKITTRRGTFSREVLYPLGDPRSPMTWHDINHKFMSQAEPRSEERL